MLQQPTWVGCHSYELQGLLRLQKKFKSRTALHTAFCKPIVNATDFYATWINNGLTCLSIQVTLKPTSRPLLRRVLHLWKWQPCIGRHVFSIYTANAWNRARLNGIPLLKVERCLTEATRLLYINLCNVSWNNDVSMQIWNKVDVLCFGVMIMHVNLERKIECTQRLESLINTY